MRVALLVVALLLAVGRSTAAQPAPAPASVALLPLDADQRLEIYGQPVASEIARALVAGSVDVVVVGRKMVVPDRARLIVDGTLAAKGAAIVITLRVRNPLDGKVLDTLTSTAASLVSIDKAASDLSTRLLPVVKQMLVALDAPPDVRPDIRPPEPAVTPEPRPLAMLVAVSPMGAPSSEPLRVALSARIASWAGTHRREPRSVMLDELSRARAARTVAAGNANLGIAFEIAGLDITPGAVPLARARVRVRIADASTVLFDRVIITDSIVGDRGMAHDQLVERVVTELLWILRPHLRRLVGGWS